MTPDIRLAEDERVDNDKQAIAQRQCPVCSKQFEDTSRWRNAMQQHIRRGKDGHHGLFRELYWRKHFRRGGYHMAPKRCSVQEVEEMVNSCYKSLVSGKLRVLIDPA